MRRTLLFLANICTYNASTHPIDTIILYGLHREACIRAFTAVFEQVRTRLSQKLYKHIIKKRLIIIKSATKFSNIHNFSLSIDKRVLGCNN